MRPRPTNVTLRRAARRIRSLRDIWLPAAALIAAALAAAGPASSASSSSTVVGATVPSATSLSITGCPSYTPDVTDFGLVTPGSAVVTGTDCSITFGSSNDTATLRTAQADGWGSAMWAIGHGALDPDFGVSGVATIDIGPSLDPLTMAFDSQHRILVGGAAAGDGFVARLLPDGSPDLSFDGGGDGVRTYPSIDSVDEIDVTSDDGAVLLGLPETSITRINEDGTLDTSCNTTGTQSWGSDGIGSSGGVVIHDDGTMSVFDTPSPYDFRLRRLSSTCQVTATLVYADDGDGSPGSSKVMIEDSAGRLITAGTRASSNKLKVCRTLHDLTADASWGGTGSMVGCVTANLAGTDKPRTIIEEPDGNILVTATSDGDLGLWRIDGSDGTTMSTSVVTMGGTDDYSIGGTTQLPDGSIVALADDADLRVGIVDPGWSLSSDFGSGGIQVVDAGGADDSVVWSPLMLDGTILALVDIGADAVVVGFDGADVANYSDDGADLTGDDWGTPGAGAFGACMIAGSSIATSGSTWAVDASGGADCADGDSDPWNSIPTDPAGGGGLIANTSASGVNNATVDLRFGLRTTATQAAGSYFAPIEFSVVAPAA